MLITNMLMCLCLVFSLILFSINNPMMMSFLLVGLSVILALQMTISWNLWFSFIILLVFTGGMMIMSLYISSLATWGLPLKFNINLTFFCTVFLMSTFLTLAPKNSENPAVNHILGTENLEVLVFVLFYLLSGLFVVVFVIDKSLGAMRL